MAGFVQFVFGIDDHVIEQVEPLQFLPGGGNAHLELVLWFGFTLEQAAYQKSHFGSLRPPIQMSFIQDNEYLVEVTASDGTNIDAQMITVTVNRTSGTVDPPSDGSNSDNDPPKDDDPIDDDPMDDDVPVDDDPIDDDVPF